MSDTGGEKQNRTATSMTRRRVLKGAGGLLAASALPAGAMTAMPFQTPAKAVAPASDLTSRLARYMVAARDRELPPKALLDTKHHLLDTLGAMISGAKLKPGEMAIRYVRTQGGTAETSVLTTDFKTTAINAAFAGAMFAHSDETDDFEPVTKTHPGSCVVPAALAVAEKEGRSGTEMLRAVALGYDLCCRFLMALGPDLVRANHRSAEGTSSTMGAMAAAASLAKLDETGMHYALSYASQQTSGLWSWVRDSEHIEKTFDFSGMGARNGVSAVVMVQNGFSGVRDILTGEHNVLDALSTKPDPEQMVAGLGSKFYVTETAIKTYSVGYPIQAALDAFLALRKQHNLRVENVDSVVVRLPEDGARIVDNRAMPDVNLQYNIAVALLEGGVSFVHSHSREHMADAQVRSVMQRVTLIADRKLMDPEAPRSGLVEVKLRDGRTMTHFTKHPSGTKENPLTTEGVNAKVRDLMAPVLGAKRTEAVIQQVNALEKVSNMRDFVRSLLTV